MNSDPKHFELCWQVEAACSAAWPASEIQIVDGYEFRFTAGTPTRRVNTVNPTPTHQTMTRELVEKARAFYSDKGMGTTFRVPTIGNRLDEALDGLEVSAGVDKTNTIMCENLDWCEHDQAVAVTVKPSAKWLEFATRRVEMDVDKRKRFFGELSQIPFPVVFGEMEIDDELAAIAFVVVVEDIAIVESVETAPKFRRQGRAAKLLSSLLSRARTLGADKAALQVVDANQSAKALYQKLGFTTNLYDYHYRTLAK